MRISDVYPDWIAEVVARTCTCSLEQYHQNRLKADRAAKQAHKTFIPPQVDFPLQAVVKEKREAKPDMARCNNTRKGLYGKG
jgi:hypothetical protein